MINANPLSAWLREQNITDPALIAAAEALAPGRLFPHQDYLLRSEPFRSGRGFLLLSPTGTGKSLLGHGAMLVALAEGRRVFWLVPSRALLREQAALLGSVLAPKGYRVAASSGEERQDDDAIIAGEADVAIVVYEKMLALWPRLAEGALPPLIVADEAHLFEDPERGAPLLTLLRLWHRQSTGLRILALAAHLSDAPLLARSLSLPLIRNEERPVRCRRGAFDWTRGELRWEGDSPVERLPLPHPEEEGPAPLAGALRALAEALPGPRILFVPTRRLARELAEEITATSLLRVEVHSLDRTRADRLRVEQAFRAGEIDLCVATTTLAEGLNLRAATAILLEAEGLPGRDALREACLGRVGRPGAPDGHAIVVSMAGGRSLGADRFVRGYSEREATQQDFHCVALALRTLGPVEGTALAGFFERGPQLSRSLAGVLHRGLQYGFWARETDGRIALLPPGRLLAEGAALWEPILAWRTILRRFAADPSPLAMLFLATATGLRREPTLAPEERAEGRWITLLRQHLDQEDTPLARYLAEPLRRSSEPPRRLHVGAKAALLWLCHQEGQPLADLAHRFSLSPGIAEEALDGVRQALAALRRTAEELGHGEITTLGSLCGQRVAEPDDMPPLVALPLAPEILPDETLVIRRGTTGLVRFCGREVQLTRIQFRLLELLARHSEDGVPYERVERYVWPDAQVERQQVAFHRKRLEQKLCEAAGRHGPLIETHAAWGLRLLVPRERIRFEEQPVSLLSAPSARIIAVSQHGELISTPRATTLGKRTSADDASQPQQTHWRPNQAIAHPDPDAGNVRPALAEDPYHYRCGG